MLKRVRVTAMKLLSTSKHFAAGRSICLPCIYADNFVICCGCGFRHRVSCFDYIFRKIPLFYTQKLSSVRILCGFLRIIKKNARFLQIIRTLLPICAQNRMFFLKSYDFGWYMLKKVKYRFDSLLMSYFFSLNRIVLCGGVPQRGCPAQVACETKNTS